MANGLNTIMIKRDISSSSNNNNNYIKIEQSLNNTMIKREIIDCSTKINNNIIKSQQNLLNNKSISTTSPTSIVNCGNTKMGSRRIFTPQFKLLVLESYRNDNDCKGNQRATARKYGIHRRQIQKWLQCESNLRTSVANLNNQTNNNNNNNSNVVIKHQFHNITHNQQHNQQNMLTNLNNNNNNQQQYNKISSTTNSSSIQLSLDSARHSVALNSIQTLSPPLSTTSSSSATTVASMAATITTQSNLTSMTTSLSSSCSPISIKTPLQINCKTNNNGLLHHHHHQQQQQQQMPYLTHTPAINTSVSVPIPIIPTHSAAAAAAAYYHHQYHLQIQHHNDIVSTSQNNQHIQQNENRMPSSVSLPVIHQQHYQNATSVPHLNATVTANQTNELHDYQPIYTTPTSVGTPIALSPNYEEYVGNRMHPPQQEPSKLSYENMYNENHEYYQVQQQHQPEEQKQFDEINRTATSSPIDLSLGHKKERSEAFNNPISKPKITYDDSKTVNIDHNTKLTISKLETIHDEGNNTLNDGENVIVDLSCRKRKPSIHKYEMPPEKVQKINNNNEQSEENYQNHNNDEQQQQPKPVKLFKPYLLDNNDENILKKSEQQDPIIWSHHPSSNYDSQCSSRGSNFHVGSPMEYPFPVGSPIYNHHNNNLNNNNSQYYQQSHINTSTSSSPAIQSPCPTTSADSCCNRSTIVPSPISSVSSPRSPQTNTQFWCPKGSPVSGYDTASTYSDCSDNYKTKDNTAAYYSHQQQQHQRIAQQSSSTISYSIDIKMHTIDNNYYTNNNNSSENLIRSKSEQYSSQQNGLYRNHHVQRWLDQDSNADVRHGIAVYV